MVGLKINNSVHMAQLICLMLLLLPSFINAVDINYTGGSACNKDICDSSAYELSLSNWRVVVALALLTSALFISIMLMVGKAISDNSIVTRARNEFTQLILTTIVVVIIILVVQFMCSSVVPSFLYGSDVSLAQQNPTLIKYSCNYLVRLADWVHNVFKVSFWAFSSVNVIQSLTENVGGRTVGEVIDILSSSLETIFSMVLASYVTTVAQIFILKFIQPFTLLYLLPVGIVLRSFFPFRRFGGALIGVSLALFFVLPLLLTLNAYMMESKFNMTLEINTACTANESCCSYVCNNKQCQDKLTVGNGCELDLQCSSGICENIAFNKKECVACITEGNACNAPKDCCIGLTCSEGVCGPAKKLGEQCDSLFECGYRACINGNCSMPASPGTNCSKDEDCYSGKCNPSIGKCTDCNLSANNIPMVSVEGMTGALSESITNNQPAGSTISKWISTPWVMLQSKIAELWKNLIIAIMAGIVLPIINLMLLSIAVRDLSNFFGAEVDLSSIWRVV